MLASGCTVTCILEKTLKNMLCPLVFFSFFFLPGFHFASCLHQKALLLSKGRLSEENLAHVFRLHAGYASLGQAPAAKPVPVNSVGIALLFLCPQLQGTQQ